MEESETSLGDIQRILLGETPPEFLIEVLVRTLLIFLFLLVFLRIIGKRMGGVLTFSELAVMLTLGAILAPPMQTPERGILQGLLILVCVLLLQRGVNLLEFKSKKIEQKTQGKVILLVKDGRIHAENLLSAKISRQQIFAQLRKNDVFNLGKVKRMYLEAGGVFSIYEFNEEKHGLSIIPPSDLALYQSSKKGESGLMACCSCGNVTPSDNAKCPCEYCHSEEWNSAIVDV